ncbi:MAG: family 78 glycoside hydrolase catalytic domain [Mucilaginibacter sp.]|nr:family 78 glycoside hydrolase catalytic domain [Mucilaginibacter sp.]
MHISNKLFGKSEWITNGKQEPDSPRRAPVFLKDFSIQKPVSKVQIFISALGLFEAQLNGRPVSNDLFAPGFTNYERRIGYRAYDITNLVQNQNKLVITVGEGWYRGPFRGGKPRDNYGDQAGLIAKLVIRYSDGSIQKIVTDQNWHYIYGPIKYSEFYGGELYDANISKNNEKPVQMLDHSKATLYPETKPPVRRHETFPCKVIRTEVDGSLILDFKQNLAGWVQLNLKGRKGDTIKIEHTEVLDKDGNIYTGNLRDAKATDKYVLNGIQRIYEPHFTYHGFRMPGSAGSGTARLSIFHLKNGQQKG